MGVEHTEDTVEGGVGEEASVEKQDADLSPTVVDKVPPKEETGNPVQGSQERAAEQQLPENLARVLNSEPVSTAAVSQGEYGEIEDADGNVQTVTVGHKAGSPVIRPADDASSAQAVEEAAEAEAGVSEAVAELNDAVCSPDTSSPEANYGSRNNIVPAEYP